MTGKTGKAGTIGALAGARAFPPLMIVLYHFSEGHHYSGLLWLDRIAARGYLWVEFFFALSGFILTYAYSHRLKDLLQWRGYGDFLRARLIRLYPLHLFMLLFILAMVITLRALAAAGGYVSIYDLPWHQDVSPKGFVLSLFLVQAWGTMDRLTWNGLSWFVSVEFALCLLFPALLYLSDGRAWRGVALVAAGVAGLLALLATSPHGLDITFDFGVLRGLADFTIGVGLAVLFRQVQDQRIPEWTHSLVQALLILLLVYSVTSTGWAHTGNDIYTVLPLLGLIFALAFDKGIVARALNTRLPQMVGEWSYAIYLGQTTWLMTLRFCKQRVWLPPDTMVLGVRFADLMWWLEPLGLVILCVLWGALLARFVEFPAAAWLRQKLGRRLDPPSVPTPS
ncbi:MAG: acyltransferase [Pseudomonadota bacterium]